MLVDSLCVQLPTFLKKSLILFRSGSCTEASWRTEKIELYVFVHQYFFIICFVVRCISGDYRYSRFEVEIRCLILYFSLTEITNIVFEQKNILHKKDFVKEDRTNTSTGNTFLLKLFAAIYWPNSLFCESSTFEII